MRLEVTGMARVDPPKPGMTLRELGDVLEAHDPDLSGDAGVRVTGVRQDSRWIEPGELFVARRGRKQSGAEHLTEAIDRGARALLVDRELGVLEVGLPVLYVTGVERALSLAAEAVLGYPSRALQVIGITGTNGKTSVSALVEHALSLLGQRPARLGTLGFSFGGALREGALTTPEADDLSRAIAEVRDAGGTHFVMEVSSHALSLERVSGLAFRVAAFTNLTQDHLDFHASMQDYAEAKARLFTTLDPGFRVINVGDAFGRALSTRAAGPVLTVARDRSADVSVLSSDLSSGIRAEVQARDTRVVLDSPLIGAHNLENLLVALGILLALGHAAEPAARALGSAPGVPGRLERCDRPGDDILVAVDYAHTPDALLRVLQALGPLVRQELILVMGCGGDRDRKKRPEMGAVAGRGADLTIVTNDNPRSEDPGAIAEAIVAGLKPTGGRFEVLLDRAEAIEKAILGAQPGDVVLLAGKGHEPYQLIGDERRPFDDRVEAKRALALRRARGSA